MKNSKTIVITGASSGLGAALARHYAAQGVQLYLHGRNSERLEIVAKSCRALGANVACAVGTVTDKEAMKAWLAEIDATHPIDLVIANAGISAGTGSSIEADAQVRDIFAINVDGVLNTIQPIIPNMVARGRGQIALMSSLAGIRGLPGAPAYSASKGCVRMYGEGLRGLLARRGVHVNVICPGYIKTPMTDANDFPMPFIMSAEKAAAIIARGLAQNRSRIAFPKALYWPLILINMLPNALLDVIFSRLPSKSSFSETGA